MPISEDKKNEILKAIHSRYKLQSVNIKQNYLLEFSILNPGRHFELIGSWDIKSFKNESMLSCFKNSYEKQEFNMHKYFKSIQVSEYYIAIQMKSEKEISDIIIRPDSLRDKVADFFLGFDLKMRDRGEFNSKYILESKATLESCEALISKEVSSLICASDNFYMQAQKNDILLKHEQEMDFKSSLNLLAIAKSLDERIGTEF